MRQLFGYYSRLRMHALFDVTEGERLFTMVANGYSVFLSVFRFIFKCEQSSKQLHCFCLFVVHCCFVCLCFKLSCRVCCAIPWRVLVYFSPDSSQTLLNLFNNNKYAFCYKIHFQSISLTHSAALRRLM